MSCVLFLERSSFAQTLQRFIVYFVLFNVCSSWEPQCLVQTCGFFSSCLKICFLELPPGLTHQDLAIILSFLPPPPIFYGGREIMARSAPTLTQGQHQPSKGPFPSVPLTELGAEAQHVWSPTSNFLVSVTYQARASNNLWKEGLNFFFNIISKLIKGLKAIQKVLVNLMCGARLNDVDHSVQW